MHGKTAEENSLLSQNRSVQSQAKARGEEMENLAPLPPFQMARTNIRYYWKKLILTVDGDGWPLVEVAVVPLLTFEWNLGKGENTRVSEKDAQVEQIQGGQMRHGMLDGALRNIRCTTSLSLEFGTSWWDLLLAFSVFSHTYLLWVMPSTWLCNPR